MATLHIHTYLPPAEAVKQGIASAGTILIEIHDTHLSGLPSDLRTRLANYTHEATNSHHYGPDRLRVLTPGWQGVLDALQAEAAKTEANRVAEEKQKEENAARKAVELAEYLATPNEYYCRDDRTWGVRPCPPHETQNIPEVQARLAIEKAEIDRRNAESKAKDAEIVAAKKAAAEARRAQIRKAIVSGKVAVPSNVVRAAKEGRDVSSEAQGAVYDRLLMELRKVVDDAPIEETYDREERTDVPSAEAYELYDKLVATKKYIEACVPDCSVSISPIMRFDLNPKRSYTTWRTGVRVEATVPLFDFPFVFDVLAEPIESEGEDSDEE